MRKIFLALLIASVSVATAQATQIGIQGGGEAGVGETGSFQIIVDTSDDPGVTFVNGGIGLDLTLSDPSVARIDDFEISNPGFFGSPAFDRWSGSGGTIENSGIVDLNGFSVSTRGLDDSAPTDAAADGGGPDKFLFATVNYTILGAGTTEIGLAPAASRGDSALYSLGNDVSSTTILGSGSITGAGTVIPEPTSIMLAGLGLIGFVAKRRRS